MNIEQDRRVIDSESPSTKDSKYDEDLKEGEPELQAVNELESGRPVHEKMMQYAEGQEPQNGVAQMEAITATWSRRSLIVVYIWYVFDLD